eukprot:8851806-Pyramimonas_sp.AAC.1
MALAGGTCVVSMPGAVPSWRPSSASAQPPARREAFFQYLEPLKLSFLNWLIHEHGANDRPTAAQWWP